MDRRLVEQGWGRHTSTHHALLSLPIVTEPAAAGPSSSLPTFLHYQRAGLIKWGPVKIRLSYPYTAKDISTLEQIRGCVCLPI